MTAGEISSRYARALLRYAASEGVKDEVYGRVQALLEDPSGNSGELGAVLGRFVSLVRENGRLEYISQIFKTFLKMYRESEGIVAATLFTVSPIPGLEERLRSELEEHTGRKVVITTRTDRSLIGGFVLKTDELLLDASVKRRIEDIRREYVISTNRIV